MNPRTPNVAGSFYADCSRRTIRLTLQAVSSAVLVAMYFVLSASAGLAVERDVEVKPGQDWVHLFSGRTATLKAKVVSKADRDVTVAWSMSVSGGIIGRGEQAVMLKANNEAVVSFDVDVPELKPGVIAAALLRLSVRAADGAAAFEAVGTSVVMHVMSPDALANRAAWWKSLDVVLFDPAEATAKLFAREALPVRLAGEAECAHLTKGLVIYGAGMEEAHAPAVWNAAIDAAESGRRVLILGSPGEVAAAGRVLQAEANHIRSVMLRRADSLVESDRRLDSLAWPAPGRLQMASLRTASRGDETWFEIVSTQERAGWAGLDVKYRNGGRLVWTGVGFIESWDATPAARYGLVGLVEEITKEEKQVGKGLGVGE